MKAFGAQLRCASAAVLLSAVAAILIPATVSAAQVPQVRAPHISVGHVRGNWAPTRRSLDVAPWHSHPGRLTKTSHGRTGTNTAESANWAGMVDSGGTAVFTEVQGEWTVPAVAASASDEDSVTWIGIDGATNTDLIQTGTAQDSGPDGGYYAWVELLPNASIDIGAVDPGDEMEASIDETSAGDWTIFTEDVTLAQSATNYVTGYYPPSASAEWIEEAPIVGCCQATLADFGTTGFIDLGVTATDLSSATLTPVEMVNSDGTVLAYPSAYDAGTNSFAITYGSPPPSVTSLSVADGSTSGGTTVTISGSNFNGAYAVEFGGVSTSFIVDSADTITASSPAEPAGAVNVTVSTPWGVSALSGADQFTYTSPPPPPAPPPTPAVSGYDLVGSDGGVFVFSGGFYGSLPGLGIHVDNIAGIVPTATDTGYFLVGSDGGVFAFNAPFANSLPGVGVHVNDIVGIVPTLDDQGYFLVGRDGGVFSFNAPFENSLPGIGIHVDDITGIAVTPDDNGYWLVGSNGTVYAFGDATNYGSAPAGAVGITATHDGGGYWVVGANGAVSAFGDAGNFGDLPDLGVNVDNIVGIVVSPDSQGYNLFGSDGGAFSFGDATYEGSLPGLGVQVDNVVGAVPT